MLLAICIPTHHGRAALLARALDSLAAGVSGDERVEVCVSDNASTDETAQVVADFAERVGRDRVRYRRHDLDRGVTANMLSVIEMAEAQWCWFLGSDDIVAPGAVEEVVALVQRHPAAAGATLNRSLVDRRYPSVVHHDRPELLPAEPGRERELHGVECVLAELGQLHDFISTQVLDRQVWLEAVRDAGEEGLARGGHYPHLVLITLMIRRRPIWVWYPRELVEQRIGASAMFDDRWTFDVAGYEVTLLKGRADVWEYLFGRRSTVYRALMRKVWWRQFSLGVLLNMKLSSGFGPSGDLRFLRTLPRYFWWLPEFWATSPALLAPGWLMRALRPFARAGKERWAGARQRYSQ